MSKLQTYYSDFDTVDSAIVILIKIKADTANKRLQVTWRFL